MLDVLDMMFEAQSQPFELTIASSVAQPNLPNLAAAAGWDGYAKLIVNIAAPYINTLVLPVAWVFPQGVELVIAAGSFVGGTALGAGYPGGTALKADIPVSIRNNGTIAGGGGGGGVGSTELTFYRGDYGSNAPGGAGGAGQGFRTSGALAPSDPTPGTGGDYSVYVGAVFGGETNPWSQGGPGGDGGAWGQPGASGGSGALGGSYSSTYSYPPGPGSAAGKAVEGNANITWLATGTRLGAVT